LPILRSIENTRKHGNKPQSAAATRLITKGGGARFTLKRQRLALMCPKLFALGS
jgi:hypothetical protein